ncbi:MAG: Hsp20/alpha crystallin family protein [Proteobacteria bacterium]|nr:Hsp20/alpha crystallin family protein [Pseudomonadota bacterium]MBU4297081.1 Hsp20/alpha crystallin family protein [Pseudomonadota bacterium]MCG2749962.1 Hsp20/alpha crystallin family protein [Desulfobulbaceae bacterium]
MFDLIPSRGRKVEVPDVFGEMEDMFQRMWKGSMLHDLMLESERNWAPRLDVSETDTAIEVIADLPGLEKKDIDISLENSVLVIKGERKEEHKETDKHVHRMERRYGSFYRALRLPTEVKSDKIEASFKNGELKITLPKSEEAKKNITRIEVH